MRVEIAESNKHGHSHTVNKAFTLRLERCALIGLGAFIMLLALDIKIRSPLDVAGYVLGIGGLWYAFELIVMQPKKKSGKRPPPRAKAPGQAMPPRKRREEDHELGEDHFD
jgi:hypothetical protein